MRFNVSLLSASFIVSAVIALPINSSVTAIYSVDGDDVIDGSDFYSSANPAIENPYNSFNITSQVHANDSVSPHPVVAEGIEKLFNQFIDIQEGLSDPGETVLDGESLYERILETSEAHPEVTTFGSGRDILKGILHNGRTTIKEAMKHYADTFLKDPDFEEFIKQFSPSPEEREQLFSDLAAGKVSVNNDELIPCREMRKYDYGFCLIDSQHMTYSFGSSRTFGIRATVIPVTAFMNVVALETASRAMCNNRFVRRVPYSSNLCALFEPLKTAMFDVLLGTVGYAFQLYRAMPATELLKWVTQTANTWMYRMLMDKKFVGMDGSSYAANEIPDHDFSLRYLLSTIPSEIPTSRNVTVAWFPSNARGEFGHSYLNKPATDGYGKENKFSTYIPGPIFPHEKFAILFTVNISYEKIHNLLNTVSPTLNAAEAWGFVQECAMRKQGKFLKDAASYKDTSLTLRLNPKKLEAQVFEIYASAAVERTSLIDPDAIDEANERAKNVVKKAIDDSIQVDVDHIEGSHRVPLPADYLIRFQFAFTNDDAVNMEHSMDYLYEDLDYEILSSNSTEPATN